MVSSGDEQGCPKVDNGKGAYAQDIDWRPMQAALLVFNTASFLGIVSGRGFCRGGPCSLKTLVLPTSIYGSWNLFPPGRVKSRHGDTSARYFLRHSPDAVVAGIHPYGDGDAGP